MTRYDPSVTMVKVAATVALLVFGLRLLAPVPPLSGWEPVPGQVVEYQTP